MEIIDKIAITTGMRNVRSWLRTALGMVQRYDATSAETMKSKASSEYSKWWRQQNANRISKYVRFEGVDLWVEANVFSPDPTLTNSTSFVARTMPNVKGKRVLDVGTGCGALAVLAALRGADRVHAIDIDPNAVANACRNVREHHLEHRITVASGNLLEGVSQSFDVAIANLPIDSRAWGRVVVDVDATVANFIEQVWSKLVSGGVLLLAWASFGQATIDCLLRNVSPNYIMHLEDAFGVTWIIYEMQKAEDENKELR